MKKSAPPAKDKAKPKPKAATAKPSTTTHKAALAKLTSALAGKRAYGEIRWSRKPRKVAARLFAWASIDAGEREDLLSDTFGDGIIEAFMEEADGPAFRAFAIPFAYVETFPAQPDDEDDWVAQPAGLLVCDTRDGSVHLVQIDGTALVEDVERVAPTIEQLGLQAL